VHWDPATYNDEREFTLYVWHNYQHLLTAEEFKVWNAVVAEQKAEGASPALARAIRERFVPQDDPQVAQAIAGGFALFQQRARDRMLAAHSNEVIINRCARCQRIVARPRSRQCLWCGHDWHAR
jgi:hypothetical protein